MNRKTSKRHSAPSAAAGSAAQLSQAMVPWGAMGSPHPMMYGWPPHPATVNLQGPMFSQLQPQPSKPWEDSESDSDDFQPKSRKKMKTEEQVEKANLPNPEKRGRGRPRKDSKDHPSKSSTSATSTTSAPISVPEELKGYDGVAIADRDSCKSCRIYVGKVVLKPCGHAFFCRQCVNGLRTETIKMNRPSKCPLSECYCLVSNWQVLINVNA